MTEVRFDQTISLFYSRILFTVFFNVEATWTKTFHLDMESRVISDDVISSVTGSSLSECAKLCNTMETCRAFSLAADKTCTVGSSDKSKFTSRADNAKLYMLVN